MIVFDVKCSKGHEFEAWFRSSEAFDEQRDAGTIECPVCGDYGCEKALMAPNIAVPRGDDGTRRAALQQAWQQLQDLRRQVESNCEYVGPRFAEEARRIHYGETEKRDIYGEASSDDAKDLRDEGVEFGVIPWLPRAEN